MENRTWRFTSLILLLLVTAMLAGCAGNPVLPDPDEPDATIAPSTGPDDRVTPNGTRPLPEWEAPAADDEPWQASPGNGSGTAADAWAVAAGAGWLQGLALVAVQGVETLRSGEAPEGVADEGWFAYAFDATNQTLVGALIHQGEIVSVSPPTHVTDSMASYWQRSTITGLVVDSGTAVDRASGDDEFPQQGNIVYELRVLAGRTVWTLDAVVNDAAGVGPRWTLDAYSGDAVAINPGHPISFDEAREAVMAEVPELVSWRMWSATALAGTRTPFGSVGTMHTFLGGVPAFHERQLLEGRATAWMLEFVDAETGQTLAALTQGKTVVAVSSPNETHAMSSAEVKQILGEIEQRPAIIGMAEAMDTIMAASHPPSQDEATQWTLSPVYWRPDARFVWAWQAQQSHGADAILTSYVDAHSGDLLSSGGW